MTKRNIPDRVADLSDLDRELCRAYCAPPSEGRDGIPPLTVDVAREDCARITRDRLEGDAFATCRWVGDPAKHSSHHHGEADDAYNSKYVPNFFGMPEVCFQDTAANYCEEDSSKGKIDRIEYYHMTALYGRKDLLTSEMNVVKRQQRSDFCDANRAPAWLFEGLASQSSAGSRALLNAHPGMDLFEGVLIRWQALVPASELDIAGMAA
ncbi:hypothetical protein MKK84_24555 [Methylobacterium sp. E-065]|uniref:hypothetical protein n=1 Tax=Methylobacterium sp. E-065 TaxID=2836583 RepID=UPI001FBA3DA2|nr:hypothetical protein [Methylobacterium sp. E-065]MCJ2020560.1 hypothetical protein [Methylobacterium sp. E-065]